MGAAGGGILGGSGKKIPFRSLVIVWKVLIREVDIQKISTKGASLLVGLIVNAKWWWG